MPKPHTRLTPAEWRAEDRDSPRRDTTLTCDRCGYQPALWQLQVEGYQMHGCIGAYPACVFCESHTWLWPGEEPRLDLKILNPTLTR